MSKTEQEMCKISEKLWSNPELPLMEYKAAELVSGWLKNNGTFPRLSRQFTGKENQISVFCWSTMLFRDCQTIRLLINVRLDKKPGMAACITILHPQTAERQLW